MRAIRAAWQNTRPLPPLPPSTQRIPPLVCLRSQQISSPSSTQGEPPARRRSWRRWTAEDNGRLDELRSKGLSPAQISLQFPGRTPAAIRDKLYSSDFFRDRRENSFEIDTKAGKKGQSIRKSLKESRLRRRSWTAEETQLLMDLRAKRLTWPEVARHFPTRTKRALHFRAYWLGLSCSLTPNRDASTPNRDASKRGPWTKPETTQLLDYMREGKQTSAIAKELGRSVLAVCHKVRNMKVKEDRGAQTGEADSKRGLTADSKNQKDNGVGEEEADAIWHLSQSGMKDAEIALRTRLPVFAVKNAIASKMRSLRGSTAPKDCKAWTEKDVKNLIKRTKEGVPYARIARELGRTYSGITSKLAQLRRAGRVSARPVGKLSKRSHREGIGKG